MSNFHTYVSEEQTARQQALIDLLSIGDSDDIRRKHHLRLEGKPDRHAIVPQLASTFIQRHLLEGDVRAAELQESRFDVPCMERGSVGAPLEIPFRAAAKRQFEALAGASSRLKLALAVSFRTSSARLFH